MSAVLERFRTAGVTLEMAGDKLRAIGPLTPALRDAIREQKPQILAELAGGMHRRWRVTAPDRGAFIVTVTPPADAVWMMNHYPGAQVEPLPDRESVRPATDAEAAELTELIRQVLKDWSRV